MINVDKRAFTSRHPLTVCNLPCSFGIRNYIRGSHAIVTFPDAAIQVAGIMRQIGCCRSVPSLFHVVAQAAECHKSDTFRRFETRLLPASFLTVGTA